MARNNLLIEFLTEELPSHNLLEIMGESFTKLLCAEIKNFLLQEYEFNYFATPRRFGCIIHNVIFTEPSKTISKKGPSLNNAFKDGIFTAALNGFLKSNNLLNIEQLTLKDDGYYYSEQNIAGKNLDEVLSHALTNVLKKLPLTKRMQWGNNYSFIRPIHNILIFFGSKSIPLTENIFGLKVNDYTYAHRIMHKDKLIIKDASCYLSQLESGYVIADFNLRRNKISINLKQIAKELSLIVNIDKALLNEVTALVEYPVVLFGEFDRKYLALPKECLILTMARHQKYFALFNVDQNITNKFLFVANILSTDPQKIILGNQKVINSRLADAEFFYNVDKKQSLASFNLKLSHVIYHNKLGTQLDKIKRIQKIASLIAPMLDIDAKLAYDSAYLIKADLASEMVVEFPELQGVMGKYYALNQGYDATVANAIEKHYYPRFSGDILPDDNLSITLALSDKLETIVGVWLIARPTGEKDPFALRRLALGIVRMLLIHRLNICNLLEIANSSFTDKVVIAQVYDFILQRLIIYLSSSNYSLNLVQNICSKNPEYFYYIPDLLSSISIFIEDKDNLLLIEANKRIENILKKNPSSPNTINVSLFANEYEHKLYNIIEQEEQKIKNINNNWPEYFTLLARFNQPITEYFDNVMVIDSNLDIRANRLALLDRLYKILNSYINLSALGV